MICGLLTSSSKLRLGTAQPHVANNVRERHCRCNHGTRPTHVTLSIRRGVIVEETSQGSAMHKECERSAARWMFVGGQRERS